MYKAFFIMEDFKRNVILLDWYNESPPPSIHHLSCHSDVSFWKTFMLFVKDFWVKMALLIWKKSIEPNYMTLDGKKFLVINAVAFEKYVSDSSQKNWFFPDGIKVKSDVWKQFKKDPLKRHVSKNKFGRQYWNISSGFSWWICLFFFPIHSPFSLIFVSLYFYSFFSPWA